MTTTTTSSTDRLQPGDKVRIGNGKQIWTYRGTYRNGQTGQYLACLHRTGNQYATHRREVEAHRVRIAETDAAATTPATPATLPASRSVPVASRSKKLNACTCRDEAAAQAASIRQRLAELQRAADRYADIAEANAKAGRADWSIAGELERLQHDLTEIAERYLGYDAE